MGLCEGEGQFIKIGCTISTQSSDICDCRHKNFNYSRAREETILNIIA